MRVPIKNPGVIDDLLLAYHLRQIIACFDLQFSISLAVIIELSVLYFNVICLYEADGQSVKFKKILN
jgi:hypothetical protein